MLESKSVYVGPWRHRQVWMDPNYLEAIQFFDSCSSSELEYIKKWVMSGNPFIGRVINSCDFQYPNMMPVGLMLFVPGSPKRRLNAALQKDSIIRVEDPLRLDIVLKSLPEPIIEQVKIVLQSLDGLPISVRVYGSTFWSYRAKQNYLKPNSDLDLLIQLNSNLNPIELAKKLCDISNHISIRLDGEFELADGLTVNWRELANNPDKLMVKSDSGPHLYSRQEFLERFNDATC